MTDKAQPTEVGVQPAQAQPECERCNLSPAEHDPMNWCDNQSFRHDDGSAQLGVTPPAPAAVAVPVEDEGTLLDYAMFIAHERELDVNGHKHDSDGAVLRFRSAVRRALAVAPAQEHATQLAGQGQDETMQALSDLTNALRERHHGRMPEEVQRAYDKAWAIVFAGQHAAAPAQAQDVPTPWLPYLSDRADGVKGHYAIARHNPAGYREVWNLRGHRWGSASDEVLTRDEALEILHKLELPTAPAQAQEDAPIVWPKSRDVGRIGDMSMSASLRVGLDGDNDTYVSVWDESGSGSIEFCTPGAGGGKSSRTRVALLALMVAMEADNAEDPRRDWWAARAAQGGDKP